MSQTLYGREGEMGLSDEPGVFPGDPFSAHRARNRMALAERQEWPPGALEMCQALEAEHPGWYFFWLSENMIRGWERPAGWTASRDDVSLVGADELRRMPEDGTARHPHVFGVTPAVLVERIAAVEDRIEQKREREEAVWRSMRRPG